MKLSSTHLLLDGRRLDRRDSRYRAAAAAGERTVYDDGVISVLELSTPEAVQTYSRRLCPGWNDPDAVREPICTVVYENAVDYLTNGPMFLVNRLGQPIVIAAPGHGQYFDFESYSYYGASPDIVALIDKLAKRL